MSRSHPPRRQVDCDRRPASFSTTSRHLRLRFRLPYRKLCLWGYRSLPTRWRSHSSAARPSFGAGTWMGSSLILRSFLSRLSAAGLSLGLSGFAFGLIAASVWLYILDPLQSATLIIDFVFLLPSFSVW